MTKKVTKTDKKLFLDMLGNAKVEKDVENAYRFILQKRYGGTFESPYGCDGYLEPDKNNLLKNDSTSLRLLLEAKWRKNFDDGDRFRLIAQAIYYLKRFKNDGEPLPNVLVGGDENEMFALYTPKLYHYLDDDYDWSLPPSSAGDNDKLRHDLDDDPNTKDIFVYRIEEDFEIDEIFNFINRLVSVGQVEKLRVNETTLRKAFDRFVRMVFGNDHWIQEAKKYGADQIVSIFIQSVLGHDDVYLRPDNPNILMVNQKKILVNGSAYRAFFSRYDRNYSEKEIDKITAIADRLIEEVKRRFHGDFWTPTIWADEAIRMMTRDLGEDWKEKYVVWDCAAGTKNLTRDYKFKHLFTSTIHQSEIDMSKQYNPEAISFQYDFLNDDIDVNPNSDPRDLDMPRELFEALKADKPIVFYTNPPYGHPGTSMGKSKKGVSKNKIGELMSHHDFKNASEELYCQFIYRVQKLAHDFSLSHVFFFFFFNKGFLASPAYGNFTRKLLEEFEFRDGFMINAGEFQGTSSAWGIIFSNFAKKKTPTSPQQSFRFDVLSSTADDETGVAKIGEHTMRMSNSNLTLSHWIKEQWNEKIEKVSRTLRMSGTQLSEKTQFVDVGKDFLGGMIFDGDAVQNSGQNVYILSSVAKKGNNRSIDIYPQNMPACCVAFASRKSILKDATWINDKDIFCHPSEIFQKSPNWNSFVRDCVVYSLFQSSSFQTSQRELWIDGEFTNLKNEWFFMSKEEIVKLAEKNKLNPIIYDARGSEERFVYKYLHTDSGRRINLSDEARELLLAGEEFVRACFPKRFIANQDHPEWHLMTWDAGFYQNYKIYTANKHDEKISFAYNALVSAREKLESKIRKQVYADGILTQ